MKSPLVDVVFLLCGAGCLRVPRACVEPGYTFGTSPGPREMRWMRCLDNGGGLFIDVAIPGTHNGGTHTLEGAPWHQFQRANVSTHLQAGVRFLDLGLWVRDSDLSLTRGVPFFEYRFLFLLLVLDEIC